MSVSVGGDGDEDDPLVEINVTPLVDVLLCLLIIFMITKPSAPTEKLPLNVPRDAIVQQPEDPNATLLVTLDKDGNARLGETPLSADYDQMVEQFRTNAKAQADDKIVVNGDDKTKYGAVVRIMAAARAAGIDQVGIASSRL